MLKIPGYRIQTQIHESLNSRVYQGFRVQDHLPIIFKILKKDYPTPEEITRYKLEYEITSGLALGGASDGVIQAYHLQQYESTFVILLEDFGGVSLEKIMASKKFTLTELLELAIQMTQSLGQIHAA
ncbi:MAG TPA: serine/threonine-protein kinase PknK, partial [Coleofasciculaceae cyanobacterium]